MSPPAAQPPAATVPGLARTGGDLGRRQTFHQWKLHPRNWLTGLLRRAAGHVPLWYFKRIPPELVIDVTNSCNLRCPVCPVTFAMTRPRGLMSLDLFCAIIDDLKGEAKKPTIYFNFSGEPTMNRALPDMIAYAKENGHGTFVSTNATKIDAEMARRMILAGLDRINLCMDGFSKEAQESYRVNSSFEAVKANIETFLSVKRELKAEKPMAVLQTLLTSYSESQIDDMRAWADEHGFDRIRFKTFSLGSYTSAEMKAEHSHFLPKSASLRRHDDSSESVVCTAPLSQTVVFWNGDLGLCCIDYDQVVQLPNVKDQGFVKAYRSDAAARARRDGFSKRFKICQNCSYSNADKLGFVVELAAQRKAAAAAA